MTSFYDVQAQEDAARLRKAAQVGATFLTPVEMYLVIQAVRAAPTADEAFARWTGIAGEVRPGILLRSPGFPIAEGTDDWNAWTMGLVALVAVALKERDGKKLTAEEVQSAFKALGINVPNDTGTLQKGEQSGTLAKFGRFILDHAGKPALTWLGEHWPEVLGGIAGSVIGPEGTAIGVAGGRVLKTTVYPGIKGLLGS
jgi:hypothetical protein